MAETMSLPGEPGRFRNGGINATQISHRGRH
jgi:hypothetical protein